MLQEKFIPRSELKELTVSILEVKESDL